MRRQAGFTVAELLVTLGVTVILMLGVLALFDFNNRVARVQTHLADMQQSLRVAQYDMVRLVRMAGRGGLPASEPTGLAPRHLPTGVAVEVADDVPAETFILPAVPSTRVLAGTDVLTVRGIVTSPLYQIDITAAGVLLLNPDDQNPTDGTLVIRDQSPTGVPQTLQPLKDAIDANRPEALLLVSPLDDTIFAVVELVPAGSSVAGGQATLNFRVSGSAEADAMGLLSRGGRFPAGMRVAYAGILEEYRFYVREEHVVAADLASDLAPKLSRARFLPGTNLVYGGDSSNAAVDVADNIMDLQVALGVDLDGDGVVQDLGTAADEWLFNHGDDMDLPARWQVDPARLHYLRIGTLVQTDRRDPQYQAPLLVRLENRDYGPTTFNSRENRMFRRRTLQTVIDLRNVA
ncbi:MAG TPA: PilW family protein [Thermoanaerobaculia bacterium]|nr:PilW family protein [Thermoanaerobaculia bacterium]